MDLHDLTESALVTASLHVASLSLLGRMPPLHLLLAAAIFLPGQVVLIVVVVVVQEKLDGCRWIDCEPLLLLLFCSVVANVCQRR